MPQFHSQALAADRDEDWRRLRALLGSDESSQPAEAVVDYLRHRVKARYVLVEENYVDRDHRSSAAKFYSQQFRGTPRLCLRLHFFRSDSGWLAKPEDPPFPWTV